MGRSHRKSIIREVIERLDSLMAIHQSRGQAKEEKREAGESTWAFSTGKIHSYKTRTVYQEHILAFINWARSEHQVKGLEDLDTRAEELATCYLQQQCDTGKSPYTLPVIRASLRMFFRNRTLADAVTLPYRRREGITRSRRPVAQDRDFQPANWQQHIHFERACGLRRKELAALRVEDVTQSSEGGVLIFVRNGKGGKKRMVPVLPDQEEAVLSAVAGRGLEEKVFPHIPAHWDIHAERRSYAQALYRHYTNGRELPGPGRLRPGSYDRDAALKVSQALGHNRLDIVLTHYLR